MEKNSSFNAFFTLVDKTKVIFIVCISIIGLCTLDTGRKTIQKGKMSESMIIIALYRKVVDVHYQNTFDYLLKYFISLRRIRFELCFSLSKMCYYCHTLKNNSKAPPHPSARCLDYANTHSQVPLVQRKYDHGKPVSLLPSAPPPPPPTAVKIRKSRWFHALASKFTFRKIHDNQPISIDF